MANTWYTSTATIVLLLGGCRAGTESGPEAPKQDEVQETTEGQFLKEWGGDLKAARQRYVRNLYEIYRASDVPLEARLHAAHLLGGQGETAPVEWMARRLRKAKGFESGPWQGGIQAAAVSLDLMDKLERSESPDASLALASIMCIVAYPSAKDHDLLVRLIETHPQDARLMRESIEALAVNSSWEQSLPVIGKLLESETPQVRYGARIALGRLVGETREMTLPEFRAYVEARLDVLPDTSADDSEGNRRIRGHP